MIEVKLSFSSYAQALAALTALVAVAPDVVTGAQTTGLAPSAGVTAEKQAAAIESAKTGTAAPAPAAEKRGPGRPKKDEPKPNPETPAEALAQALDKPAGKPMDYATSGLGERIAELAADPAVKAKLVALIRAHGGVSPKDKTNAKFIPADKLPAFAAEIDKLEAGASEDGDIS